VAGPGDLDLDGRADVVVGAAGTPQNTVAENLDGELRAYSGQSGALLWTSAGHPWEERFGERLATVPDLDGDGVSDLLASAWDSDSYGYHNGFAATVSGADGTRLQTIPGPQGTTEREDFGFAVAAAGDLDGDGFGDLLVSAPDAGAGAGGIVSVFSGRAPSWRGRGLALPGVWGTPTLSIEGDLDPGAATQWRLSGARPFATAWVVIGVSELLAPFKEGVLLPSPDLVLALGTDVEGVLAFPLVWPALPAGLQLHVQAWVADPDGPVGFAASNGTTGTTY
jgi:hypothetical protein